MWNPENNGPFQGRHYRLAGTLCSPQPLHRPDILIGGGGERKTLRLVAQYGNACTLFGTSPDDVARKLDALRRHCDDLGRDYDSISKTMIASNPRPTPENRDAFVASMADYARLGIQQVILTPRTGAPAAFIDGMHPRWPSSPTWADLVSGKPQPVGAVATTRIRPLMTSPVPSHVQGLVRSPRTRMLATRISR